MADVKPLVRHPSGYPADLNNTDTLTANTFKSLGGGVDAGGARVQNVATPVGANDAVNKTYADSIAQGLYFRDPARAATTTNLNLASPGASIDNVAMVVDDRVLVKNQTNKAQNGIYLWKGAAVPMVRASDSLRAGVVLWVNEGDFHRDTQWVLSTDATITPGTTPIDFTEARRVAELQAGRSIQIVSNTVSLKSGAGLTASGDVAVDVGDGVEIASNKVKVKPKASGGLGVDSDGVYVDFPASGGSNGTSNQAARSNHSHSAADVGAAPASRNLIAGAGLTGGGTLAADRTFNVGAGAGVDVTADAVAVKADASKGINVHATAGVQVKVGPGLAFNGIGELILAHGPPEIVVEIEAGENIAHGDPVALDSAGLAMEAKAVGGPANVVGIATAGAGTGSLVPVVVAGGANLGVLVPDGTVAFLGPTGGLVATPPASGRIVRLGFQPKSTNQFLVAIADYGER